MSFFDKLFNFAGASRNREDEERKRLRQEAQTREIFNQSSFEKQPTPPLRSEPRRQSIQPGMDPGFIRQSRPVATQNPGMPQKAAKEVVTFTKNSLQKFLNEPIPLPFMPRLREGGGQGFTPREIGTFGRDVAQSFPRAIAEGMMSAGRQLGADIPNEVRAEDPIGRALFGDQTLKPIQYQPKERLSRQIAEYAPVADKYKMPIAMGLSATAGIADLFPGIDDAGKKGAKEIPKLLEPVAAIARKFNTFDEFKSAVNTAAKTPAGQGFGTYMVDDVLMSMDNETALRDWAKSSGFKTEEEAFQALRSFADSSLRPSKSTGIAGTGVPSSLAADTPSGAADTTMRSPLYKYTPETSVEDVLRDEGFSMKYNSTIKEEPYLAKILQDAAGGNKFTTNIKNINTAAEKIVRKIKFDKKFDYDENKIGDFLRGNIIAKDDKDAVATLQNLQQSTTVTDIENYFEKPTKWGYNGINVQIKTPQGNLAEVQIHTPMSLEIQNALHPIYEEWRNKIDKVPIEVVEQANKLSQDIKKKYMREKLPGIMYENPVKREKTKSLTADDVDAGRAIKLNDQINRAYDMQTAGRESMGDGTYLDAEKGAYLQNTINVLGRLKKEAPQEYEYVRQITLRDLFGVDSYDEIPEQIKIYRGGKVDPGVDVTDMHASQVYKADNFSLDENVAKRFAGKDGKVYSYYVNKDDLPPVNDATRYGEAEVTLPMSKVKPIDEAATSMSPPKQVGGSPPGDTPPPQDKPPGDIPGDENKETVIINDKGKLEQTAKPKYEFDLKSLDTPDEVKETILQVARTGDDVIQKKRRGTITWKETRKMADTLGMSIEDVEKHGVGKIWNAEQADAAVRLTLKAQEELNAVSAEIKKLTDAGEEVPEFLRLDQMEKAARAQAMMAAAIGNRSETARALNAAKIMKQALDTADARLIEQAKKAFAGDKKTADEVLEKLSQFDPDDTLGKMKFLREVTPSTPIEKITEFWYNSILSNISTHVVNNVGNSIAGLLAVPERAIAGTIDATGQKAAALFGKQYTRDRYAAEAALQTASVSTGIKNGVRRFAHVMKHGISEADATRIEFKTDQAIKGKMGAIINTPTRLLVAEDELFKAVFFDMQLNSLAYREAKNMGLAGEELMKKYADFVANPTPQMYEAAQDFAKITAFQGESKSAQALSSFRDFMSLDLGRLGTLKPMQFILPFVRVAVNVAKYGLERSPAGFAAAAYKAGTKGKGEAIDSAARAIMGTALTIPLAIYATEGRITGAPPKDRKERDAFYADGKLPWSIKIGDNWVEYSKIEPLNTILATIAIWHDANKNGDNTWYEQVGQVIRGMARNTADKTFMQGLGNLFDAIEDPERYASSFMSSIAGGFIPSLSAAGARMLDDTVRAPENPLQAMMARLPIVSKQVPARESEYEDDGVAKRKTNEGIFRNIASNVLGFRTSKDTDTNYLDSLEEVKGLRKNDKARREALKETAKTLADQIIAEPDRTKRREILNRYVTEGRLDEDLKVYLDQEFKKRAQPQQSQEEEDMKNSTHRVRAELVLKKIESMDRAQRRIYIRELAAKKIFTEDTAKEMQKILKSRKSPLQDLPIVSPAP